jgi:hypothetical protein
MGSKTGDRDSLRPRAARRRLRNNVKRLEEDILSDIELVYEKPVAEWDWEELSHGRPRGIDGTFKGKKPVWITPAIQAEARKRMRLMTEDQLMVHAESAIDVLKELMTDQNVDDFGKPTTPAAVKLQAATYIINHIIGTPRARVEMDVHNPLVELMGGILVNPDGEASHQVIEGTIVVEDDSEEDDDGSE